MTNTDAFSSNAYIHLQPVSQPIREVKRGKCGMETSVNRWEMIPASLYAYECYLAN